MFPVAPAEALRYFQAKKVVPRGLFGRLSAAAKERAFSVAGVAKLDLMQFILDQISEAMRSGTPMDEFRDSMRESLGEQWGGETPARLNNIFRTNAIEAYNAGRHHVMTGEAELDDRPYWRFDATRDSRVSEICRACDGVVLPASHPWWHTHYPAMHYQCRSIVTALTEEEAHAHGVTHNPPQIAAMPGFGVPPSLATLPPSAYGRYDADLMEASKR